MKEGEKKEDIYGDAKGLHATLERRLKMLLRKPYLTEKEEIEIKILKKKKLYYKDIMERTKQESGKGVKT